jgi:hypothetical protein
MNIVLLNLRQIQGKHVRQPINYKYYSNSFELNFEYKLDTEAFADNQIVTVTDPVSGDYLYQSRWWAVPARPVLKWFLWNAFYHRKKT